MSKMQSNPNQGCPAQLLSTKDAASYLRISYWTMRELALTGRVPVVKAFKRWRFDRDDLNSFIEETKVVL